MTDTVRKILLAVLVAVFAATCLAFTITSLGSINGADYMNPANAGIGNKYNGKYTVSVMSAGGLNLDGIRVTAKLNGVTKTAGISKNGKIEMELDPGEYKLDVDESTLPEGYYIPEDADFKTKPEVGTAKIVLPSKVIATTAPAGTLYQLGDVMHDFSYVEVSGTRHTLSEMLETKKAVTLNFWYTSCVPCQSEFPAIQKAYEAYGNKMGIIALDSQDSSREIATFKEDRGLTFHMASDAANVTGKFDVKGFPTTVIIDRYGVVAYKYTSSETSESVWNALFDKYTSDNYTQQENNGSGEENPDAPKDRVKPDNDLVMPESSLVENAVLDSSAVSKINNFHEETSEKDAPYSWPWLLGEDNGIKYMYASNAGTDFTYATVYCDVTLNSGDVLSYNYNINSESGKDILYALVNGNIVAQHSGNSKGWERKYGVYIADHTVTVKLAFIFIKDQKLTVNNEFASIANITVSDINDIEAVAIDQRVAATDGKTLESNKYKDIKLLAPFTEHNDTRYYKIAYTDNFGHEQYSLLYADILNPTVWSEKQIGEDKFTTESGSLANNSLYHISFWLMSNRNDAGDDVPLTFEYGHSEFVIECYYVQGFSDNGLLPVTDELIDTIKAFMQAYCAKNNKAYYEDQWLEMCYFFRHFGEMRPNGTEHINGDACSAVTNPVAGLSYTHSYTITEAGDITKNIDITKIISLNGGGIWFKYIPKETGVYRFYSTRSSAQFATDPCIAIYDAEDNLIAYNDQNESYKRRFDNNADDFNLYVVLNADTEYRIQACLAYAQATGSYKLNITNVGRSYDYMRVASTDDGSWNFDGTYNAVEVALNTTGTGYYHVIENYNYGSVMYIDFIHSNYFDKNNNSLYDMVVGGRFNFTAMGGNDYTQELMTYYYKSRQGKEVTDPLYGLIEADQRLVEILNELIYYIYGDGSSAYAWLMFGCYYVHYSV